MTMTREAIADRLVSYADAAAAFSAVNSLAFVVTLTQPEVRCTLVAAKWLTVSGSILQSLGIALVVVMLRKAEIHARASSAALEPAVERFLRGFFVGRLGVIAFFALFTIGSVVALSRSSCPA